MVTASAMPQETEYRQRPHSQFADKVKKFYCEKKKAQEGPFARGSRLRSPPSYSGGFEVR